MGNTVITSDSKRYLRAVIGFQKYKVSYYADKVDKWLSEIDNLCKISKAQPQAATKYHVFYADNIENYLTTSECRPIDSFLAYLF